MRRFKNMCQLHNKWAKMKTLGKRKKAGSDFPSPAKMGEDQFVKMEETVSVSWNHFEESAVGAFKSLEEDTHFTDVTLACADGQVIFNLNPFYTFFLQCKVLFTSHHPDISILSTYSTMVLHPSEMVFFSG